MFQFLKKKNWSFQSQNTIKDIKSECFSEFSSSQILSPYLKKSFTYVVMKYFSNFRA